MHVIEHYKDFIFGNIIIWHTLGEIPETYIYIKYNVTFF